MSGEPKMKILKTATFFLLLGMAVNAFAALYGAPGNTPGDVRDTNLYILDENTGAVLQTVGPTGFPITGLDFHPLTGELWATSAYDQFDAAPGDGDDPERGWLLRIDPATGQATPIAQHDDCTIVDISFADDGTLFGWRECEDVLVTINLATAETTEIGTGASTRGQGMEFAPDGRLYMFGESPFGAVDCSVVELDPVTGDLTGAQVALSRCSFINAGADDGFGTLYVSEVVERGGAERNLTILDLETGDLTTVGGTVDYLSALTFGEARPTTPVPTLDIRSLTILGGALLLIGGLVMRRRNTA